MEIDQMVNDTMEVTETRKIERISVPQIFRSLLDAFNLDRGVLFTIKQLFVNPGKAIVSFLGKGRYHFVPPFRLLIVTTAIVLYLISVSKSAVDFGAGFYEGVNSEAEESQTKQVQEALAGYMNLILWTFIPVIALFTYFPHRKRGFNYAEHLVFHTYLFCIANIFGFLMPLDHYLPVPIIWLMVYVPMVFYYIFAYRYFLAKSWLRAAVEMTTIFFVSTIIWGVLFVVSIAVGVVLLSA
jgi:hypothetical protein